MQALTDTGVNTNGALKTLDPSGAAPGTRIASATQARTMVLGLMRNDELRARKRALVKGLVDGNPPYSPGKLKEAGRATACNVNWRVAESYLGAATGAFYDVFHEAPTYAEVQTDYGPEEMRKDWSNIITEEFDRLLKDDNVLDYPMQISINEMVLYGSGPLWFNDATDWRPQASEHRDLYVPDLTKSDTKQWEWCARIMTYQPHELYERITDPEAATAVGWRVAAVRNAIIQAAPESQRNYTDPSRNWEYWQQQLKNGGLYFSFGSKVIRTAHVFWREFAKPGETDGKISHAIIALDSGVDTGSANTNEDWLFHAERKFDEWCEVVNPMYYDHGGGGYHHSVAGMGVKMFGAMEWQNRLMCNLADKVFAPKVLFRPTSGDSKQKLALTHLGDYGSLPAGWDAVQVPMNGFLQEGMEFNREIGATVASNLSQYRQNLQQEGGNPITASEVNWRASEQARLGKTQLNRYYQQLDDFYEEVYERAASDKQRKNLPGGAAALEFQNRCTERGVPVEALRKVNYVRATRIAGQGSPFMRQQALEFLLGMVAMLPEGGRQSLIQDVIAARSGQAAVRRYFPTPMQDSTAMDQAAEAQDKVAAMKVGLLPLVTPTQNALIYATTFLNAGDAAAATLQQGANPAEVAAFLDLIGQATAAHLQRLAQDKTRAGDYKQLEAHWKKLAQLTDQLHQELAHQAQAQAEQPQGGQAMSVDDQLKMKKAQVDIQIKEAKANQALELKAQKFKQDSAIHDAKAAQQIEA
jgi:hypothetical protein